VVHVTNVNITLINVHPRNYAYARHAVVVPQRDFYTVNNYKTVRVKNINNTTIINNYQAAPVVNNTVIKDYSTTKQKYNFANVPVKEKPHKAVNERIETNQKIIKQGKIEKASMMEQQVKGIKEGKIDREAKIQQPKATNYIVPAHEVNRPKSEMKLQQKELKRAARESKEEPGVSPKPTGKPIKPSAKPEGVESDKFDQPTSKPERVRPPKPRPTEKTEDVVPAKPGRTTPKPEGIESENIGKPISKPEKVKPPKPNQKIEGEVSEKPTPKRERVAPPKPQPKVTPEKVAPAKDDEPNHPNKKPGRTTPPKVRPHDKQKGEPDEQEKPR
jgi:hypothetical protein